MRVYKDWNFPDNKFFREKTEKKQITLHHTVSGPGVDGDIDWWLQGAERIATSYIIDREGRIHRCFGDEFWGWHIGCKTADFAALGVPYCKLDLNSIGIELDSWGALARHSDGKFYPISYAGGKVVPDLRYPPVTYIYEYCPTQKFRGIQYFEQYTTAQLDTLHSLLIFLQSKHNIPAHYSSDIWSLCRRALQGQAGIYSHASYRADKTDCHPQTELVNLLKSL